MLFCREGIEIGERKCQSWKIVFVLCCVECAYAQKEGKPVSRNNNYNRNRRATRERGERENTISWPSVLFSLLVVSGEEHSVSEKNELFAGQWLGVLVLNLANDVQKTTGRSRLK